MKYHYVEPEVAGGLGEKTVFDRISGRAIVVQRLHYEFDGWLGDELLESTPCFIVSERLAHHLEESQLTGIDFDEVEITKSGQFQELHPGRELPEFLWLRISGQAGQDDFGLAAGLQLVVSERALTILQPGIPHAVISDFA